MAWGGELSHFPAVAPLADLQDNFQWKSLTIVFIDVHVARFRVKTGADQGEHGQLLHLFLVS